MFFFLFEKNRANKARFE